MALEGSPLLALAQQGAKASNHVIATERSASNHRGEPSISNRTDGWRKCARSEVAALASGNRCLADNDVHQQITQNYRQREYCRDRDNLRNVIDDQRRLRARSPTPPRCSLARDDTPSGSGGFRALASSLRQIVWPEKFKPRHIGKYDGSSNPEEFIQVYHMVIEAAGGDGQVNVNYLPTTLFSMARS
jgi:hypothetical protein